MKRVLLIGGAGYVGVELQKKLINQGYAVRVYDTFWYPDGKLDFLQNSVKSNLEYVTGDVRDLDVLQDALDDVDFCIHLACISNDPSYELNPLLAREINYLAFEKLIPLLNQSKVRRFIFASSSSVYGVKTEPNVTEELSLEPLTDYSKYKILCEQILFNKLNSDIEFAIVRPSTICGVSKRQRFDLVVNILTMHAITGGVIKVEGGEQYRPNLHIEDMVEAYSTLLKADRILVDREVFNVAGENLTVMQIAEKVKKIVGKGVEIMSLPVVDNRSYRVSGEKIRRQLGFYPRKNIEDAIRDLVRQFHLGAYSDPIETKYYNLKRMQELLIMNNLQHK